MTPNETLTEFVAPWHAGPEPAVIWKSWIVGATFVTVKVADAGAERTQHRCR